jgi:hypothetical protein
MTHHVQHEPLLYARVPRLPAVGMSKLGFRTEAYELLREAIEIDSHDANPWYNLAVMYTTPTSITILEGGFSSLFFVSFNIVQ